MKISIEKAIRQAQQDPNSDFSTKIRGMIESGQLDQAAEQQGFDLSPYGRPGLKKKVGLETLEDFKGIGEGVLRQVEEGAKIQEGARESFEAGEISGGEKILQQIGGAAKAGAGAIGEAFKGGIKMLLPQKQEQQVKEKVGEVAGDFMQTVQDPENTAPGAVAIRNLVSGYNRLKEEDPEKAKNIDAVVNIGELAAEFLGVGAVKRVTQPGLKVAKEVIEEGATRAGKYVDNVVTKIEDAQDAISAGANRLPADSSAKTELTKGTQEAYLSAFVDDKVSITNQLNKMAGKRNTTREELVRGLAEEGYIPKVNKGSKLADMNPAIENMTARVSNLAEGLDEALIPFDKTMTLDDIKKQGLDAIRTGDQFPAGQIDQGERFVETTLENWRKRYGDNLTVRQQNQLRAELNKQFKEGADVDAAEVMGDVLRQNIDEIAPIATDMNREIGRLLQLRKTASVFNGKPIDVGPLGGQLGRFGGAIAAGAAGAGLAGPGGLVISGIAAHYGGNVVAQVLRSRKFSQESKNLLIEAIKRDEQLLKQLKDTADTEARKYLESLALPAPTGAGTQINVPPELPTRSLPTEPQAQQIIDVDVR